MFHNVQGEYWYDLQLNLLFSWSSISWDDRNHTDCHAKKCRKSCLICYENNFENYATFVEGFWPEFHARRRFMKYSMYVLKPSLNKQYKLSMASEPPPKMLIWYLNGDLIKYWLYIIVNSSFLKQNSVPYYSISSNSRMFMTYFLIYVLWLKT